MQTHLGDLPKWVLDKYEVLRRVDFHDSGLLPIPRQSPCLTRVVVKPRFSRNGLAHKVFQCSIPHGEVDIDAASTDNYVWQRFYAGRHLSVDVVYLKGTYQWSIWSEGFPDPLHFGQFLGWVVYPEFKNEWIINDVELITTQLGLHTYSGIINIELILDRYDRTHPIEVHFRPSLELGPLYGPEARLALMKAGLGEITTRPYVVGGTMVVTKPNDQVIPVNELDEHHTWRHSLTYSINEQHISVHAPITYPPDENPELWKKK